MAEDCMFTFRAGANGGMRVVQACVCPSPIPALAFDQRKWSIFLNHSSPPKKTWGLASAYGSPRVLFKSTAAPSASAVAFRRAQAGPSFTSSFLMPQLFRRPWPNGFIDIASPGTNPAPDCPPVQYLRYLYTRL